LLSANENRSLTEVALEMLVKAGWIFGKTGERGALPDFRVPKIR
jgi:hypothetical protein